MSRASTRRLLWIAAGIVAISVGLALGRSPWRSGETGQPAPGPATTQTGAPAPVALDPIIALSPFGRVAEPAAPEPEPETEETALNLVLLGVVIATDPKRSTAILEGGTGPSRVYTVGAEVASGATLDAVFVDHVVLRVDGTPETLSFPASAGTGGGAVAGTGGGAVAGADGGAVAEPPAPAEPEASEVADLVAQYQSEMQADPVTALEDLGLVATEQGYEVVPDGAGTLLPIGFQPGDVITKVNGQQVGDIDRDVPFFNNVVASGHARIDLLRNGQRIVLSFSLK